jgi:spore coat protein U-like protein
MMRRLALALFLLACCALPAEAACTVSATNVVFGTYTGALLEYRGTITVNCSYGATYHVGLDGGNSGSVTARTMVNGAYKLNYALTSGSYTGTNWGNTTGSWVSGTGSGRNQTIYVYGKLAAAQYVAPSATMYTDPTITVTVSGGTFTTVHATFTVTATVVKDCGVSATALGFGNYTGAVNNASATVTVTCTNTTPYTVGLGPGLATGATVITRQMAITQPAGALNYSLLTGSYTGTNWGNTSPTWFSGNGTGAAQPLTVYGVIPAGQHPTPGSYTDTITATVTY